MRAARALAILLAIAATASPTRAEQPTVSMTVKAPLGLRASGWNVVEVELRNFFGETVAGELVFGPQDAGYGGRGVARQPVELSPGARKRFEMYALWQGWCSQPEVVLYDAGGDVIASSVISNSGQGGWVHLFVEGAPGNARDVMDAASRVQTNVYWNPAQVRLLAEELPERVCGLRGTAGIFLCGVELEKLSGRQLRALRDWVLRGGRLIVIPDGGGRGLSSAFMREVMGGSAVIRTEEGVVRWDLPSGGRSRLTAGGEWGQTYDFGDGSVCVLKLAMFDDRLKRSRGPMALGTVTGVFPTANRAQNWDAFDSRSRNAPAYNLGIGESARMPAVWLIIVIVGAYVLVTGPGNYFFLRRRGLHVHAAWTIPAIGAVFVGLIFGSGYLMRGVGSVRNTITLLRVTPGQPYGICRTTVGLFPSHSGRLTVSFGPLGEPEPRYRPTPGLPLPIDCDTQDGLRVVDYPVRMWEGVVFSSEEVVELGGGIVLKWDGEALMVCNETRLPLGKGVIVSGGRAALVGPLPARTGEVKVTQMTPVAEPARPWRAFERLGVPTRVAKAAWEMVPLTRRGGTIFVSALETDPVEIATPGWDGDGDDLKLLVAEVLR